ncbi:hypothetical protein [Nocardioides marmotae]|uniref:hypothetical protein n=1 Tax=Nocardioides marmotae TaxID=2663857 RepID=UPI0012B55F86|nr:hypothetical protein [Nocardioides marmotae]MBC9734765.1 hypothetical protein [Nocardioides marmotae]MTB85866.1 hypothetical protein [Nocardioides marmotae]
MTIDSHLWAVPTPDGGTKRTWRLSMAGTEHPDSRGTAKERHATIMGDPDPEGPRAAKHLLGRPVDLIANAPQTARVARADSVAVAKRSAEMLTGPGAATGSRMRRTPELARPAMEATA